MSGAGLKVLADEIVRSLGDMLLHLGCDTGTLVPNTTLNASNLNARIAQYQLQLDTIELEVVSALTAARAKAEAAAEEAKKNKQSQNQLESQLVDPLGEPLGDPLGDGSQSADQSDQQSMSQQDAFSGIGDEIGDTFYQNDFGLFEENKLDEFF